MTDSITPTDVQAAIACIEQQLPSLIGPEAWATFASSFSSKLAELRRNPDQSTQLQLSADLVGLIAEYPAARERLLMELQNQFARKELSRVQQQMLSELTHMAAQFIQVSSVNVQASASAALDSISVEVADSEDPYRFITLTEGGLNKASSFKIKNFNVDFGKLIGLVSGVVLVGKDYTDKPNPLLVCAGILLIIRGLYEAVTVEISERETSVFWGFINAKDNQNMADEASITAATNKERKRLGLDKLKPVEVKNSLFILKSIKSLAQIPGTDNTWQIREKYRIKRLSS